MPHVNDKIYLFILIFYLFVYRRMYSKVKLVISAANYGGLSRLKQFESNVICMLYSYKLTVIFLNIIKLK